MSLKTINLENHYATALSVFSKRLEEELIPSLADNLPSFFDNQGDVNRFKNRAASFLAKTNGQCKVLNTLAFPSAPKSIDGLYVPLTVSITHIPKADLDPTESHKLEINSDTNLFAQHNHILINDNAGMGKSTISKKISGNIFDQRDSIPIFIELRTLASESIKREICKLLGLSGDLQDAALSFLPFIYIFDGLDEVAHDDRAEIVSSICAFAGENPDSKILVTSRKEDYLADFYSFAVMEIDSLTTEQAIEIIGKYDNKGEKSTKLVSLIESDENRSLSSFLTTPLYVTLLYCAYSFKSTIPQKKHLFYSQLYEALFQQHDLSKEIGWERPKHSKLDSTDFHEVLRRLAISCLKNSGRLEFQLDELRIEVRNLLRNMSGISTQPGEFVRDLTSTVPLFVREGTSVRWSHKSLMEYFAAMFICMDTKDKQTEILLNLHVGKNWSSYYHLFELCLDIDYSSFRSSIVKEVLSNFVEHFDYCCAGITNNRIKRDSIELRKSLMFVGEFSFGISPINKLNGDIINKWVRESSNSVMTLQTDLEPSGKHLHALCFSKVNRTKDILRLLKRKNPSLFLPESRFADTVDLSYFETKSSLEEGALYRVSDDANCITNNSVNFDFMNSVIAEEYAHFALDIKAVRKELAEIDFDSSNGVDELVNAFL